MAGAPAIVLAAAVAVKKLQLVRLAAGKAQCRHASALAAVAHNAFAGSGGGGRSRCGLGVTRSYEHERAWWRRWRRRTRGWRRWRPRWRWRWRRGGGGGGGGRRSDIALKHDISLLGHLDNGIGFYRFSYNGSDKAYVGVMAQEVQVVAPDAVTRGHDGYLRVFYDKLGLQFQSYDQWLATGARIPSAAPAAALRGERS